MRILSMFVLGSLVSTLAVSAPQQSKPHLESEMTSSEYEALLARAPRSKMAAETDPELDAILKLGKRNLLWLSAVNAVRTAETQLPLSTPETQRGIPIDAPSASSPSIIKKKLATLKSTMPESMAAVLFGTATVPADTAGVEDAVFLQNIRDLDRLYQSTSRWLLQAPYLEDYKAAAAQDVRGYYYLNKVAHLKLKLRGWQALPKEERDTLRGYLVNICLNNQIERVACQDELTKAEQKLFGVYKYYAAYWPKAVTLWESYFTIPKTRPEFSWDEAANVFVVPFRDPANAAVAKWFEENVEDEWKWNGWQLDIQYTKDEGPLAHLQFEEGATPHVNDVAGDTITMDANRSLQEYTSRWTIRHEFGHVLGFPDCYVEFYDVNQEAMVNYQLDITNLMCSRKGKFKEIHFNELKRAYLKTASSL